MTHYYNAHTGRVSYSIWNGSKLTRCIWIVPGTYTYATA